ncbi:major facilitator superfamily domain-containing protein [Aspergillus venezuelensis]
MVVFYQGHTGWSASRSDLSLIGSLMLLSLMTALDATILIPALPTLTESLDGTATDAFWAGTSFLLANAVCQPVIAAISKIFGRKNLLIVMILVFSLGTAVACSANAFPQLLAGRSLQGIGAGGIFSMVLVIFTDIIPLRLRPRYWAAIQAAWAVGTVAGPVIGGACSHPKTWRWIFYINFPICAISLVAVPFLYRPAAPSETMTEEPLLKRLYRLDYVGYGLFLGSTTSFLIGVTLGGVQYDWVSVQVLVPILFGLTGIILTIAWERCWTGNAFLPVSIFGDFRTTTAYLCGLLQGLILLSEAFYIAIYFEGVKLFDPLKAGLSSLPLTAGMLPVSVVVGILMTRTGRYHWCLWVGWPLTTIASGLLILLDSDTKPVVWITLLIIIGVGHGFLLGPGLFAAQATCTPDDAAVATSMYSFMRSFGMCLGVAVGGTMFQNVLKDQLKNDGLPGWIATDATAYAQKLRDMKDSGETPGIGAMGFGLSLFIKKRVME